MRRQSGFLEGDRAAVLSIRAHRTGAIDYTKCDSQNPSWWKHWRFLIHEMDKEVRYDLLKFSFEYRLALVSSGKISADDFSAMQREARGTFQDIDCLLRPWLGATQEERERSEGESFKDQWKQLAGFAPDDKEAISEWAQAIKDHTKTSRLKREAAEQEDMDRHSRFHATIEAVRRKRIKQQGR